MNRVCAFVVALCALGAFTAVASAQEPAAAPAAVAGGACVSDQAKQTLAACPNNGPQTFDVSGHGKAPQVNFHSAPPPAQLKKRDQQTKPNLPTEQMSAAQRDDRKNRLQSRATALLVTEIQRLENLFSTTPANAPDRIQVTRRLAEEYVELETSAFR